MLCYLSVKNIVLIEELSLDFKSGLTVLTGETGAGKSILLDSLGLALGARADFGLLRKGTERASVTARFEIAPDHPVWQLLDDAGIERSDELLIKRQIRGDGKSPASINDEPVSVNLLRMCGDMLVEIQGQFEGRGLLDASNHLGLLDRACQHDDTLAKLKEAYQGWHKSRKDYEAAEALLEKAREEEEWLRDAVEQLDLLDAKAGEDNALSEERALFTNLEKIAEALGIADDALRAEAGADAAISRALSAIERVADAGAGRLDNALDALSRTMAELSEASAELSSVASSLEADPTRLQQIDDRLHEIRTQARKHNVSSDELPQIHESLAMRLAQLDDGSGNLAELKAKEREWRDYYQRVAQSITERRRAVAAKLDEAVMAELPPLKLEAARFATLCKTISDTEDNKWTPLGWDIVRFEAAANPGQDLAPIEKAASGGELARFLLALKVVLARTEAPKTLIFDEVDSGVGGAVAAAVGERLSRLGKAAQTLVITHSPQVAAKGTHHYKIAKSTHDDSVISRTDMLTEHERAEEIARMLAGEHITPEARAAAVTLLGHDSV